MWHLADYNRGSIVFDTLAARFLAASPYMYGRALRRLTTGGSHEIKSAGRRSGRLVKRAVSIAALAAVVIAVTAAARWMNPLTLIGDIKSDEATYVSMALSLVDDGES